MGHSSHASLQVDGRWPKAEKIRRLLDNSSWDRSPCRILEIGTGSGAIAHYFSTIDEGRHEVFAVDVADQRIVTGGYRFAVYNGVQLPFDDHAFDIVISNHVIEHVGQDAMQSRHVSEIARVLAPCGQAYLAAPSRWQVVEPHFGLPFLSWLPARWRNAYVRLAGRGSHYDCHPMTHAAMERLLDKSGLIWWNRNVDALEIALHLEPGSHPLAAAIARAPPQLLRRIYRWSPTMVYLLRPPADGQWERQA